MGIYLCALVPMSLVKMMIVDIEMLQFEHLNPRHLIFLPKLWADKVVVKYSKLY